MQKKIKLHPNEEKITVEVKIDGKINAFYELRLHQEGQGKIDTFEGDNFYNDDDTYHLPNKASENIHRTLVIDASFHSKIIPPQAGDKATYTFVFFQGGKEIDRIQVSENLNGEKQFFLVFIKFVSA